MHDADMSNAFDTSLSPTREPVEIIAGDFIAWRKTDLASDYPNSDYSLSYVCRSEGTPSRKIDITAVADGDDYLVEINSTKSATFLVANYQWTAYITRNSDSARATLDNGIFTVVANKAISSDDPRSLPQKMIAEIERAMLGRATNNQLDTLAYELGTGVSATRDTTKLIEWRTYWQRELIKINRKIAARKGKRHSGTIRVRF